jgi:TRAP transporter TAXI family solute receptor
MKKLLFLLSLVLFGVVGCSSGNEASSGEGSNEGGKTDSPETHTFSLLTTDSSSSFYAYFVGAANAISTQYPELQITVTETGGASDNIQRLNNGESAFSLGVSVSDYKAYIGDGFEKNENLRAAWYFAPAPFNFVVSKDSGIESIEELDGVNFSLGGAGTSTEKSIKEIFALLGINPEPYNGSMSDAQNAFSDRRIEGLTKSGKAPDSYVQQVSAQIDINLLGLTEEQAQKVKEAYPYYSMATIPAGSYKGVDHDVLTPQFMLGALLDASVPQEVGYKMWDALMSEQGKEMWGNAYPAGKDVDLFEVTLNSPIPLHAGTVQYLKENGVDVPDNLIPPEYSAN